MKKQILDLAKLHESMNSRYQGVEEQMGAIKLSLSRFNHEYKLLEAAHEDLKARVPTIGDNGS